MAAVREVGIVGAGPIGIELAVALKQRGVSYYHFEAGSIGSTIAWYAPQTTFFSSAERLAIAGVPLATFDQSKPSREVYLNYLRGVVSQFQLEISTYTYVSAIKKLPSGEFELTTQPSRHGFGGPDELHERPKVDSVEKHLVRKVVLAIGDMHLPNMLHVPGEDRPHVSHYLGDLHHYFNSEVVIIGGKNSAVEAAIRLYRLGCKVTIATRGNCFDKQRIKYWLYPELMHLIRERRITHLRDAVPVEFTDKKVCFSLDGKQLQVPADFVLLLTGYRQSSTMFDGLDVEREGPGQAPVLNPETMESSVPGVYVAGTAVAGTQIGGVREFIETSHIHVERIVAALRGTEAPDYMPRKLEDLEN